ncbi:hypothetical protein EV361DRAFT_933206 [Lentinula raphanica]|nr:hypothetical protein EV361DRAFT_933206 [Lentinula raphanica]
MARALGEALTDGWLVIQLTARKDRRPTTYFRTFHAAVLYYWAWNFFYGAKILCTLVLHKEPHIVALVPSALVVYSPPICFQKTKHF